MPLASPNRRRLFLTLTAAVFTLALALPQATASSGDDKDDDVPGVDPYTRGANKAMRTAGYVRFGPFVVTPTHNTKMVQDLIGTKWMLWVETDHFKIGSTLRERVIVPIDRRAGERRDEEIARLTRKLPRLKRSFKERKLDEWATLHLHAQRLEDIYQEIARRFNVTKTTFPSPGDKAAIKNTDLGPYLGCKEKFIVLLFEQTSSLARYRARYTAVAGDKPFRQKVSDLDTVLFVTARQPFGQWPDEDTAFLAHLTGNLVRAFCEAYRGYKYTLPLWWEEGLAHWYCRRIDPKFFSPTLAPGQKYDYRRDENWPAKVYARVKNDYYPAARDLLNITDPAKMDFADHMMAWSRIDYLFSLGNKPIGIFMDTMNELPWTAQTKPDDILEQQRQAMQKAWGLDPETFDLRWTRWVLKTYRKR